MVLCDKIHRHFLLWPHVSRRRGDSAEGTSVGRINLLIVEFVLGSFQLLIGFEEGFVCGYMTYDVRPLLQVVTLHAAVLPLCVTIEEYANTVSIRWGSSTSYMYLYMQITFCLWLHRGLRP